MLNDLSLHFSELLNSWDCEMIEFGGEADHIHVLFEATPTVQISNLVKNIKSASSKRIRRKYAEHLKPFYWKPYFWNRAYAIISTGGRANIETLIAYIENQDNPKRLRQPLTKA